MIKQIENYLRQNFINVPLQWIEACVTFIKSEHGSSNIENLCWLQEKVYEQWLHSDLTELGTHCLPFNLRKENLINIDGTFALQINYIKDIGLAAYSQLQKLRKDDVENTNVSAEKDFTAAWEPKPSRMLLLQLTDGTTVIQGMEYRPINFLSLSMKPGVKILLKGKIECRRGMLLLTSCNVTVLGGEVESLYITNAPENLMRRTLRLEESDDPIPVPETFVPTATQDSLTQSQYYNTQTSQINPFSNTFNKISKVQQTRSFSNHLSPEDTSNQFEDDLEDFIDMETEMALLEAEKNATILSVKSEAKSQFSFGVKHNFVSPPKEIFNSKKSISHFKFPSNKNVENSNSNLQTFKNPPFGNDIDFDDGNDDELLLAVAEIETVENKDQFTSNVFKKNCQSNGKNNNVNNNKNLRNIVAQSKCQLKTESSKIEIGSLGNCFKSANQLISNTSGPSIKKTSLLGSEKSRQTSLSDFRFCKNKPKSNNNHDISPSKDHIKNILQTKPYQYICFMNLRPKEKMIYTVKGFFTTLLSKIEQNDGKWNLAAKINDGTGSCDIDIDDSILRDMIEMSVEEFKIQKQLAMNDFQLRSTLAQRVLRCQMELIRTCCLLQIEVNPSLERPKVVKLISLSDIHLTELKARAT